MFKQYNDPAITIKNITWGLVVVLVLLGAYSSTSAVARDQSEYYRFKNTCLKKFEDASNTLLIADARIVLNQGLDCSKEMEKDGAYINLTKIKTYLEKLDGDVIVSSPITEAIKRNLQVLDESTSKRSYSSVPIMIASVFLLGMVLIAATFQALK